MYNKAILIGNLGEDPQIRETEGGKVANIRLATSSRYKDKNGEAQEKTYWHNVVAWGGLAETIEKYTKKGDRIQVDGEITYRSYEDKDGNKRMATDIRAYKVNLLSPKGSKPQPSVEQNEDDDLPF